MGWPDLLQKLLSRDRRRGWRKIVAQPALIPLYWGPTLPVEITEASPTGFRLRSPRKIPTGVPIYMTLSPLPPDNTPMDIPVEIRWNRHVTIGAFSYRCGGRFLEMSDLIRRKLAERLLLTTGLEFSDLSEKRRDARLVREARIGSNDMAVRDISASGVGLVSRTSVPVGDRVTVELNLGGPLRCAGTVVWNRPTRDVRFFQLGVRFDPMDEDVQGRLVRAVDRMIQKAKNGKNSDDDD